MPKRAWSSRTWAALAGRGPAQGALHRVGGVLAAARVGRALIEHHRHVRADQLLDAHALGRAEEHLRAVHRAAEAHALLADAPVLGQREDLVAAAVRQDRPVPAHEAVQAAQRRDRLRAGPQGQVVGVRQDHARPGGAELFGRQAAHGGAAADGHEGGRLHRARAQRQPPGAGPPVPCLHQKVHRHSPSVPWPPRNAGRRTPAYPNLGPRRESLPPASPYNAGRAGCN